MEKKIVIANWKSNLTSVEAITWLEEFRKSEKKNIRQIICAPYILLSELHAYIQTHHLDLELGAQDISPYPEGAHTGQVNGEQIKEFASWVMIGHHEVRMELHETIEERKQKVKEAKRYGLHIIYCIGTTDEYIPDGCDVIAYEPADFIGSGKTQDPREIKKILDTVRLQEKESSMVYGGGISVENCNKLIKEASVEGLLIGSSSLQFSLYDQIVEQME